MSTVWNVRQRGCGWPKPGGVYLVCPSSGHECGKLPRPLVSCPCCHSSEGIRPSRAPRWINTGPLFETVKCRLECEAASEEVACPLKKGVGDALLLWIGAEFYKTAYDFLAEADDLGISRRLPCPRDPETKLPSLPKGFKPGETWVLLAHANCIPPHLEIGQEPGAYTPGIFRVFKPAAVYYVEKGDEPKEFLEKLEAKGITPVVVNRIGEQKALESGEEEDEDGDA